MAKKAPKSPILKALRAACQDERAAAEFLEVQRWGDEPCCPRCGGVSVYKMKARNGGREKNFRWRCRDCKRMYSVRTGLVLEETRLPLRVWVYAFWKASSSKKGISALQIKRELEISYKSALFLMHRIRYAMTAENPPKLSGTVEADEAWIGGKPRHRRPWRGRAGSGIPHTSKVPVMAMVQRHGEVRVRHLGRVTARNLGEAIWENVEQGSKVYTDENSGYKHIRRLGYDHDFVKHTGGEYARGDVTTNTVEGFFALLKRGIYGTFHSVSKHHLHRYLAEFAFKWNTRKLDDGERTIAAIQGAEGKRLLYAD